MKPKEKIVGNLMVVKKVKIGRRKIPVKYKDLGDSYYGLYYFRPREIHVNSDMLDSEDNEELGLSLLHECLHGIWDERKIPERAREERIVTDLAEGLKQLFKDNCGLLEYLSFLVTPR